MHVSEITVSAGRTFNHPYEQYSNLRPHITLKATLSEGDDPVASIKQLQAQAEQLVEDHKHCLPKSIEHVYRLSSCEQSIATIESQLKQAHDTLDEARAKRDELKTAGVDSHLLPFKSP